MIYLARSGEREGPFSEAEINQKLSAGDRDLAVMAWREGLSDWISVGELLGIKSPPPLPTTAAQPTPPHIAGQPAQAQRTASAGSKFVIFVIIAFGLLGAVSDVSLARAIQHKVDQLHSDLAAVPWYWQLVFNWLYEQWGEHFFENAATVANILFVCGVGGGLSALLFLLRRYSKVLAVLLLICALAPLLYEYSRPLTFVGSPMAVAAVIGFFVRDRRAISPIQKTLSVPG